VMTVGGFLADFWPPAGRSTAMSVPAVSLPSLSPALAWDFTHIPVLCPHAIASSSLWRPTEVPRWAQSLEGKREILFG
jgi:hypothetical protein